MFSIKPTRPILLITTTLLIFLFVSFSFAVSTYFSKEKVMEYSGLERRYRIHLPFKYNSSNNYPVLIALHGFGDSPKKMELYTGLNQSANKNGFIVVYPYGTTNRRFGPLSWNGGICCNYAYETGVDDVGFINALIDELVANYNVNSEKVYVTGFSNGGILANLVATKLPDKVSGAAIVSGAIASKQTEEEEYTYIQKSETPVPVVIFHGKNDGSISFNGGESSDPVVEFASAYDMVNFWLENNKCEKHPTEISRGANYTKEVYSSCEGGSNVVFYAINDGKHEWPGWRLNPIKNIMGKGLKANDLIWDFFSSI